MFVERPLALPGSSNNCKIAIYIENYIGNEYNYNYPSLIKKSESAGQCDSIVLAW